MEIRALTRSQALTLFRIADACLATRAPQDFAGVLRLLGELLPIEAAGVSLADLNADRSIRRLTPQVAHNFPPQWRQVYAGKGLVKSDPIARYLFLGEEPVFWSDIRQKVRDKPALRFYRLAAQHGLKDGFSFGVRYPGSRRASFFTFSGPRLRQPSERQRLLARLAMPHLHAALGRIHFSRKDSAPELSEREAQALGCVRRGKTNREIGIQMGISARTVKFHIERAMKKLQATTRTEAVAQALIHQLID